MDSSYSDKIISTFFLTHPLLGIEKKGRRDGIFG